MRGFIVSSSSRPSSRESSDVTPDFHEEEALGKVYDAQLIRRLWPYLSPHRVLIALSILLIPLRILFEVIPAPLIGTGLNHLMGTEAQSESLSRLAFLADPPGAFPVIPWLVLVLFSVMVLGGGVEVVRMLAMTVMGQRALRHLRSVLFDHVQRLPLRFFDHYPVGRLVTRLGNDIESVGEMFSAGLVAMVADLFLMAVFAGLLFWLDLRLGLVAMAVVPVLAIAAIMFRWKVREAYREVRVKIARINAHLQETISGMKIVQLFARERRNLQEFSRVNKEHRNAWFKSIRYDALLSASVELAVTLTIALILWYGAKQIYEGAVAMGLLFVFVDYMRRFFRPLQDLSAKYSVMQSSMASLERIFQLLDVRAEEPDGPVAAPLVVRGEVVFENVTFAYEDEPVLRNISFHVAPGERVAFVGPTGAGKTTVLKLLERLYEPDSGSIRIDGIDLRQIPRAELRRHLAFVLQDVFLFTGDVASNIALGRRDISDEEIRDAARAAHVDAFVRRLPHGYGQQVRERGVNFSVGERQLLSFARALAQQPQILLLDEATSSVDTETEALIQDAVHQLLRGKTSIVVAHRLSTIQDVDRIYVIQHGEIRETGSHEQLLAARGLYWRLYQLQYASQERSVA
jgi:ATP-binding cassette subfamily B multidrug efflux pump